MILGQMTNRCRNRRAGFTLMEILAALFVLAIAVNVMVKLFILGDTLLKTNKMTAVAASIAEEQLALLLESPDAYDWPNLEALAFGAMGQILPKGASPGHIEPVQPPSVLPVLQGAEQRERVLYDAFGWQAYACLPQADASHVEVTLVVRWVQEGKERSIALSSSLARKRRDA